MRKDSKFVWSIVGVVWLVGMASGIWIYYHKAMNFWFPAYLKWVISREKLDSKEGPTDIMFLFVDHFEPTKRENLIPWLKRFPEIASKYRDSDGYNPRYTWFFPVEQREVNIKFAREISKLCKEGLGEIELHLHHRNDTLGSLEAKLRQYIRSYQQIGAFKTTDGKTRFAFIHGNWALDNSINISGRNRCGVNNELLILKELGCFADFTFPASGSMAQPAKINSIYYAIDDPLKPKSYNNGIDVEVGKRANGDLMIFEGPLLINWKDWKHRIYPSIDDGQLQAGNPPSPTRINEWIRVGIHVKGRPNWIFIKVFTHGAHPANWKMLLYGGLDRFYSYLTRNYNDGVKYRLHFVTAREAYNIVKAAESGLKGNPGDYRNFAVQPYVNCGDSRYGQKASQSIGAR